jgi:hypothetical protein
MTAVLHSYKESNRCAVAAAAFAVLCTQFGRTPANRIQGFVLLMVCSLPAAALSQTVFCLPPAVPLLPNDPEMLIEFRAELSAEFSQYFTDAQDYLNCLQQAHGATRLEIESAIRDYTALLDTPRRDN